MQSLRKVQLVTALAGVRMNPALWLTLNLVTPWDLWAAWLAARQRKRMATLLPAWLDAFHELEALISLGEFAALNPGYTFPTLTPHDEKRATASGLLRKKSRASFACTRIESMQRSADRWTW